MIDVFEFRNLI